MDKKLYTDENEEALELTPKKLTTTVTSTAEIKPLSVDDMKLVQETVTKAEQSFFNSLSGLPMMIDHSNLMCPTDGFILVVGTELAKKLKGNNK